MSAAKFFSLPELITLLAEHAAGYDKPTARLASLSLVNQTFHAAITPLVYREIMLDTFPDEVKILQLAKANNRHLRHTRTLTLGWTNSRNCPDFDEGVLTLLRQMPNLTTFNWYPQLLKTETLRVLQVACPKVKALRLDFGDETELCLGMAPGRQAERGFSPNLYRGPDITPFRNLECLALNGLWDDLTSWKSQLVHVLMNSPNLRVLRLSLLGDTLVRLGEANRSVYQHFFDRLCDSYGESGGAPLKLTSLSFGLGMCPHDESSLAKLVDVSGLHDVHFDNEEVARSARSSLGSINVEFPDVPIAYAAFGPTRCPSLRRFTVHYYDRRVHIFFCENATKDWARNLFVSASKQGFGYEIAALLRPHPSFPVLPLHLRMTEVNLRRFGGLYVFTEPQDPNLLQREYVSAWQVLDSLVRDDDGTVEGLTIWMCASKRDKTGISLFGVLTDALGNLSALSQLAIELPPARQPPSIELKEIATRLATACRSLRYFKLRDRCFVISRRGGVVVDVEEFAFKTWAKVGPTLDFVELFRYNLYSQQHELGSDESGLDGYEEYEESDDFML
ncbi:hypothetical protein QBC47DRAFT_116634 [Echria macrotheca]|uniref:Uncharacterized protein n=1 Tax=Echria macrotheca TaxID=438768 RepID=A0AAJ0BKE4_9PEZI|nr:hypothetical protein QBC47DRAFT_116634 [Echria macrotheca]